MARVGVDNPLSAGPVDPNQRCLMCGICKPDKAFVSALDRCPQKFERIGVEQYRELEAQRTLAAPKP